MTNALLAKLELETEPTLGNPIWIRLTITNVSDREIVLPDPEVGIPSPDLNWKNSNEAYQVCLLMSFGLIQITLKHGNGDAIESKGLMPWVTPILSKRKLQPHDTLVLNFDISELFSIETVGVYRLHVRYGEEAAYAEASLEIEIRPRVTV